MKKDKHLKRLGTRERNKNKVREKIRKVEASVIR